MKTRMILTLVALALTTGGCATPFSGATNAPSSICFVNVAKACDPAVLREVIEQQMPNIISANYRLAEVDTFGGMERFDLRKPDARFGKGAKLIVYVVADPSLPMIACVPGRWALVNVRGLAKGVEQDKAAYTRRVLKMMLKGLAFSVGVGANMDTGRCVMSQGSFETLKGIDGTSSSYSPFAAGPIMDILQEKGLLKPIVFTEE
jgi:hypothetical protein